MQFGQWAGNRAQVGAQLDIAAIQDRARRCGLFIQPTQNTQRRTQKKGENMGMKMMIEQFPEQRRQDPKRGAEARVFDALQNLDLDGHGLYEYRYRREGKQVDYPLWVHALARLAVQVKGGRYEMDNTGQWFLRKPDGTLDRVQSPLEETSDGCMEMRDGILEVTGYKNFVAGVLIFPDMERNEEMEHMARERYHVYIIWGLGNLKEDLERIAAMVKFRRPPQSRISENEWRGLHELQCGGAAGRRGGERADQDLATARETERQFILGSATINIQHLEKLIVQHYSPGTGTDERPFMPGL